MNSRQDKISEIKKDSSIFANSLLVPLFAILCCALWGSATPAIKIGYGLFQIDAADSYSQLFFAGLRFFISGCLTIIAGSLLEKKVLLPTKTSWDKILILALFQTILQYVFFYIGLAHTTAVKSAIIGSSIVFMALLFGSLIFHQEKLTSIKLLGCVIGFLGVVVINMGGGGLDATFNLNGEGFLLFSSASSAMSTCLIKIFSKKENPVTMSGYQFMIGGLFLIIIGRALGGTLNPVSLGAFGLLFYLGFLSAAAYTIWALLLKHNPLSKVSVYSFATPIFGVLLSMLFLRENMSPVLCAISLILVSASIILINKAQRG